MARYIAGQQVLTGLHGERQGPGLARVELRYLAKRIGFSLVQTILIFDIGQRGAGILDWKHQHFVNRFFRIIFDFECNWTGLDRVLIDCNAHVRIGPLRRLFCLGHSHSHVRRHSPRHVAPERDLQSDAGRVGCSH